jgi:O-antigen ligase/tetratricopeptide (TPR) repeat protein
MAARFRLPHHLDRAITWGVVSLILLTPLAVGSVEPWAFALMEVVILLLVAFWLLKRLCLQAGALDSQRGIYSLMLPAALLIGLITFQMAPLPPSVEALISPSTFELYQRSLPGWPDRHVYERPLAPRRGSQDVVLLPTSQEVAKGAAIPFATTETQSAAPEAPLNVENRLGFPWRPLSVDPSLTWPALLKLVAYLCLFFLVVSCPWGEKGESGFGQNLLRAALLAGVLAAAIGLAEHICGNGRVLWIFTPYDWPKGNPWGLRATGTFANPDHLAGYLDLALPIAVGGFLMPAAFANYRPAAVRFFCAAAIVFMASTLLLTASRGGWLGALLGFAVFAGLWPKRTTRQRLLRSSGIVACTRLGLLVLLALLVVGPGGRTQSDVRLGQTTAQDSLVSRLQPAKVSLQIVRHFPLLGVGLGCWRDVFPHYSKPPWSPTFWNATHNDYVQFAAETGLLGFGLLAWFFAASLSRVWHGMRLIRPENQVLVAACLAGISAAAVHEFFDFPLQIPAYALLFTILLGTAVLMTMDPNSNSGRGSGKHRRLICGIGLLSVIALIEATITQRKIPYPYNLSQPATPAQAYSLENAHPVNARVHLMLLRAIGDGMAAKYRMKEVRAALWLEPTNPFARDLYAQILLHMEEKKEALSEMSRSVAYSPTLDSHFYLEPRMIQWLSVPEQRAVETGFRVAVADHYQGAIQNFASYYDAIGKFPAEAALYIDAAKQEPHRLRRAEYFVGAGIAYARAKEFEKAKISFRAASAAVPEDTTAYEELILLVFGPQNDLAAARATLAHGIRYGADPFKLYLALGSAAQTSGNNSEAEAALQKAAAIQPSSLEVLVRIGALDLATNRFDRAATWLRRATKLSPSSAEAFYELGLANEGAYEYYAADQAYRQALALAPADERFKAHYTAFRQKLAQSQSDTLKP